MSSNDNTRSDNLNNLNILVVDDAYINRYVLKKYILMINKNVNILEASNGKVAIEMCQVNNIDIIFMDIKMPVMDGNESAKIISKEFPNISIYGLTGQVEFDSVRYSIKCGMKKCLPKPLQLDDIRNIIKTNLETKRN